jgi:cobalt-precorrin-6B (C15)-methyltransferase
MWQYRTPGIPDELFERVEDVPITKEEVRIIQLSKARLSSGQIVYDVGCGSGSISVEAAHQIGSSGKVFSIDIDPNAVDLTRKNLSKFQISNVSVILGDALQKINELPIADVIFIGGTGGDTSEIVKLCESKLKQGGRMVIGTILVETLYSVLKTIEKLKFSSIDIIQVTISKSKKTSTGTMFLARNPVTLISATKI